MLCWNYVKPTIAVCLKTDYFLETSVTAEQTQIPKQQQKTKQKENKQTKTHRFQRKCFDVHS